MHLGNILIGLDGRIMIHDFGKAENGENEEIMRNDYKTLLNYLLHPVEGQIMPIQIRNWAYGVFQWINEVPVNELTVRLQQSLTQT